jgi:murein DD-endopeptidase MepM/ murein hydrolase activator NlpD
VFGCLKNAVFTKIPPKCAVTVKFVVRFTGFTDLCGAFEARSGKHMQKYFAFLSQFFNFFKQRGDDDRKLMDKLRDKYRLVIMNDETFEEVSSVKLSPLAVYGFLSSLIVATAIGVTLLIVYTPLKRYIPGYGDFQRDSEVRTLSAKVRDMESEIEAVRRYNENVRNILNGDLSSMSRAAAEKQGQPVNVQDTLPVDVERIPEDDDLRAAVAKGSVTSAPVPQKGSVTAAGRDLPIEQLSFMPPVTGLITAKFDLTKNHFGIDVGAARDTPIKAAANGVVITADYTVATGNIIAIQHPNNVITMYKHNSVLFKKVGDAVKAGDAIALIGNTGEESSGPHLHFELWYRGTPVDPNNYISFQ